MNDSTSAVYAALVAFLHEGITTRASVREVEGLLSGVDDSPLWEDLEELMALYSPGGGPELADERALLDEIRWVVSQLELDAKHR